MRFAPSVSEHELKELNFMMHDMITTQSIIAYHLKTKDSSTERI